MFIERPVRIGGSIIMAVTVRLLVKFLACNILI